MASNIVLTNRPKSTLARISERTRAVLQGIAAYVLPKSFLPSLGDESVEDIRAMFGGQLVPNVSSKTRWTQQDIERAEVSADQGDLAMAGALMRSAHKDGVISGVMSTRCGGLVRLPKRFRGRPDMVDALQAGGIEARSLFDELCPPMELEALDQDGVELGVGVAELLPVPGRPHPVLSRLPPEFLTYRWSENRWYYRSIAGLLPITPGDGRWVLHTPGGRVYPWQRGLWRALGRAYVTKEHARLHRENWEMKLANSARVAITPAGATEQTKKNFFQKLMAWGMNTVFALPPGFDVKLIESKGEGAASFKDTIKEQDTEIIVTVQGQIVTTTGGTGFANAGIHESVRADLIEKDEGALSFTLNTQVLPAYVANVYGEVDPADVPTVEYDVQPPADRKASAEALTAAAKALTDLAEAFEPRGVPIDANAMATRFGVPVRIVEETLLAKSERENGATARTRLSLVR